MRIHRLSPIYNSRSFHLTETPKSCPQEHNKLSPKPHQLFQAHNQLAAIRLEGDDLKKSTKPLDSCKQKSIKMRSSIDGATSVEKKKFLILGDEQARGLASQINEDRKKKNDTTYDIFGMVQSGAKCSEILKSCETLNYSLKSDDIVILAVGANDDNPYKMLIDLGNILYILRNQNVFVINVQYNRYLNERLLNKKIQMLLVNYNKSHFVKITGREDVQTNTKKFIKMLSFKLHVETDLLTTKSQQMLKKRDTCSFSPSSHDNVEVNRECLTQNQNYVSPADILLLPTQTQPSLTKQEDLEHNLTTTCKKGTIPYFFKSTLPDKTKKTFFRS